MSDPVIIPREPQPEPETPKVMTKEEAMSKLAAKMINSRPKERSVK